MVQYVIIINVYAELFLLFLLINLIACVFNTSFIIRVNGFFHFRAVFFFSEFKCKNMTYMLHDIESRPLKLNGIYQQK